LILATITSVRKHRARFPLSPSAAAGLPTRSKRGGDMRGYVRQNVGEKLFPGRPRSGERSHDALIWQGAGATRSERLIHAQIAQFPATCP
jgi:hypothetical protein